MSFPQGSEKDSCKRAFEQAVAAGISLKPTDSKFCDKLFKWMTIGAEERKDVHQLASALERTLNRSHDDSRLVLALCVALQEYSGLGMDEFQKKITRTVKFLDKPAAAGVVKTIRTSAAATLHPKVMEITDLDAIEALGKAPKESIRAVEGEQEILHVGSEAINLVTSDKKEIVAAVRKARAETKKAAPPKPEPEEIMEADADSESTAEELEVSEELNTELDEAALALSRLLRSMPRTGRLSSLAKAIEQAQKLLELTRRDLTVARSSDDDGLVESLN